MDRRLLVLVLAALAACTVETEPPAPDPSPAPVENSTSAATPPSAASTAPARVPAAMTATKAISSLVVAASEPGTRGLVRRAERAAVLFRSTASPDSVRLDSLASALVGTAESGDRGALAVAAADAYGSLASGSVERQRAAALTALARASAPSPDWRRLRESVAALDRATDGARGPVGAAARGATEGAEAENALAVRLAAQVILAGLDDPAWAPRDMP